MTREDQERGIGQSIWSFMVKKAKKKTVKKATKRYSASDIQNIRLLAEMIGNFIPFSGYKSKFNLKAIAKEKGLSKYISDKQLKYFPCLDQS